jgi:hypothetical protein
MTRQHERRATRRTRNLKRKLVRWTFGIAVIGTVSYVALRDSPWPSTVVNRIRMMMVSTR